jgi:hypothetical protein
VTSTPAPSEPHVRAVVDLLNAALLNLRTPIKAYNGMRLSDDDTNCVVVHGAPGAPSGPLGDRYADLQIDIQLTAIATGPEQALAYADAARAALLGTAITVTGRAVWPAWQTAAQPVIRDDTVNPPLWIATAQYAIKSNPA